MECVPCGTLERKKEIRKKENFIYNSLDSTLNFTFILKHVIALNLIAFENFFFFSFCALLVNEIKWIKFYKEVV